MIAVTSEDLESNQDYPGTNASCTDETNNDPIQISHWQNTILVRQISMLVMNDHIHASLQVCKTAMTECSCGKCLTTTTGSTCCICITAATSANMFLRQLATTIFHPQTLENTILICCWRIMCACVRGHCKSFRNITRHTSFFSINKNFQTQTNRNHYSQNLFAAYHCGSDCPEMLQSFGNCHAPVRLYVRHCGLHTAHPSQLQNQTTR